MNGKKAKLLRKLTAKTTVGMPNKAYTTITHPTGKTQVKLIQDCSRHGYQALKKVYREIPNNLIWNYSDN